MNPVESPAPPWRDLYDLRLQAREAFSDPELRQTVRKAGAKLIAQLRAELASILDGRRFSDTSASHGLRGMARNIRLDLLQLVFERNDRPVFLPISALPDGDWSEIGKAGLDMEGCKTLFAGQVLQRSPFEFQKEGLRHASISLPSPLSGRLTQSVGSLIAFERPGCPIIFYIFQDVEPFLVIVSPYRGEIVGILLPQRGLLVGVERASKYHRAIATLKAMMIEFSDDVSDYLNNTNRLSPALITGSMDHFGHSIVNEYEAVHQLIESNSVRSIKRNINFGIEYIEFYRTFPELDDIELFFPQNQEDAFCEIVRSKNFVVRPTCGDYYFSHGLKRRLLRASSHTNRHDRLADKWPVIWLEVRTGHRVWIDQANGMAEIIKAMSTRYPDLAVVMAGWSQPLRSLDVEADRKMVEAHNQVVDAVCKRLPPEIDVVNLVGAPTIDKISAAQWTDSFVAGFGTAMIFPLGIGRATGVTHTNSAFLRELNDDGLLSMFEEMGDVLMMDADPENDVRSDLHYHNWDYIADWKIMLARLLSVLEQQERPRKRT